MPTESTNGTDINSKQNRDDLEDEELHVNQMTEHMPTTMVGFKDHPLYVVHLVPLPQDYSTHRPVTDMYWPVILSEMKSFTRQ